MSISLRGRAVMWCQLGHFQFSIVVSSGTSLPSSAADWPDGLLMSFAIWVQVIWEWVRIARGETVTCTKAGGHVLGYQNAMANVQ